MVGRSHAEVIHALKTVTSDQIEIGVERGNDKLTAKTTSAMALELGVVVELTTEGLIQVIECFVNGAADRSGVRVGDILLSVDGQSLIKRKSFMKAVGLLRAANPDVVNLVVASHPRVVDFGQVRHKPVSVKRNHYTVEVTRLTIGGGSLEPLGMGLGTNEAGEHHVTKVIAGGAADRGGLCVGDCVEVLNGRSLKDVIHGDLMGRVGVCGVNVTLGIARDTTRPPPKSQPLRQAPRTVLVTDSFSELEI